MAILVVPFHCWRSKTRESERHWSGRASSSIEIRCNLVSSIQNPLCIQLYRVFFKHLLLWMRNSRFVDRAQPVAASIDK